MQWWAQVFNVVLNAWSRSFDFVPKRWGGVGVGFCSFRFQNVYIHHIDLKINLTSFLLPPNLIFLLYEQNNDTRKKDTIWEKALVFRSLYIFGNVSNYLYRYNSTHKCCTNNRYMGAYYSLFSSSISTAKAIRQSACAKWSLLVSPASQANK